MVANATVPTDECLQDRKWWAFLLSSIFTFIAGIFIILIFRAFAFICSGPSSQNSGAQTPNQQAAAAQQQQQQQQQLQLANGQKKPVGQPAGPPIGAAPGGGPGAANKQPGPYGEQMPQQELGWMTEAKDWAGELISGQSTTGRILVVLVFLLSIASLIIYFVDASRIGQNADAVEKCQKWSDNITQQVDLALNVFFMVYFFIRFIAASDKLWFMLELYSFVDYFTIPPSFVSIYLDRTWIGLRFLRALRLMSFPDILQ